MSSEELRLGRDFWIFRILAGSVGLKLDWGSTFLKRYASMPTIKGIWRLPSP
jgi:hypothetical protein